MLEFDESEAVKLMKEALPQGRRNAYEDDDILLVIDLIYDFYDESGLLDLDIEDVDNDSETAELNSAVSYVVKMLRKDKDNVIELEDVPALVKAEFAYEQTLID